MKITSAWIDDPTTRGDMDVPQLCVEVTEYPDVTIPQESFSGDWEVGKRGPFVLYSNGGAKVTAGDFNVRFRERFPVVVDITLFLTDSGAEGMSGYSLPLSRARQLIRKYDPGWRLLVSDRDAEAGLLLWVPVETDPSCRKWVDDAPCGLRPTKIVRIAEVDYPYCPKHVMGHNERQARKRLRTT